eukprot:TRINITY_DN965_c0_g1_i1.p1 TRINITY_DN965_c0_g1~~TRINITY_DN965_c0_g1_i1.p1  ORF type:complete len:914 (+),score=246.09 TRINITY_DN965_c0_g1_i1:46-2742(+)
MQGGWWSHQPSWSAAAQAPRCGYCGRCSECTWSAQSGGRRCDGGGTWGSVLASQGDWGTGGGWGADPPFGQPHGGGGSQAPSGSGCDADVRAQWQLSGADALAEWQGLPSDPPARCRADRRPPPSGRGRAVGVPAGWEPPSAADWPDTADAAPDAHGCVVCGATKPMAWGVWSDCGHSACWMCALRIQLELARASARRERRGSGADAAEAVGPLLTSCLLCRQKSQLVVLSARPAQGDGQLPADGVAAMAKDPRWGVPCATPQLAASVAKLDAAVCPRRKCSAAGTVFASMTALQRHLRAEHGTTYCEVCLEARSLFLTEHATYTREQLREHETVGTPSSGVAGHPLCHFCDVRLFDDDALWGHMQEEHHTCGHCDSDASSSVSLYYESVQELLRHSRALHVVCEDCIRAGDPLPVFGTQFDLQLHRAKRHGGGRIDAGRQQRPASTNTAGRAAALAYTAPRHRIAGAAGAEIVFVGAERRRASGAGWAELECSSGEEGPEDGTAPRGLRSRPAAPSWPCARCTLRNTAARGNCAACGAPKRRCADCVRRRQLCSTCAAAAARGEHGAPVDSAPPPAPAAAAAAPKPAKPARAGRRQRQAPADLFGAGGDRRTLRGVDVALLHSQLSQRSRGGAEQRSAPVPPWIGEQVAEVRGDVGGGRCDASADEKGRVVVVLSVPATGWAGGVVAERSVRLSVHLPAEQAGGGARVSVDDADGGDSAAIAAAFQRAADEAEIRNVLRAVVVAFPEAAFATADGCGGEAEEASVAAAPPPEADDAEAVTGCTIRLADLPDGVPSAPLQWEVVNRNGSRFRTKPRSNLPSVHEDWYKGWGPYIPCGAKGPVAEIRDGWCKAATQETHQWMPIHFEGSHRRFVNIYPAPAADDPSSLVAGKKSKKKRK